MNTTQHNTKAEFKAAQNRLASITANFPNQVAQAFLNGSAHLMPPAEALDAKIDKFVYSLVRTGAGVSEFSKDFIEAECAAKFHSSDISALFDLDPEISADNATEKAIEAGGLVMSGATAFPLNDVGNGQRFAAQHGNDVRFCAPWNKWLFWDGKRWQVDQRKTIERKAKDTAQRILLEAYAADDDKRSKLIKHADTSANWQRLEAMLKTARSETGLTVLPEDFDLDPWLLNCLNGTIDLRTGHLQPHRRSDKITKLAPVNYDPDAQCPHFLNFLHAITAARQNLIDFLQKAIGYAMTGDIREHALFIPFGSGRNGKSTLLDIVGQAMGDYALQMDPKTITVKKQDGIANDIARLRGARFVATSETNDGQQLSEGKVKQMTGGEKLTGELKYGEPFDFRPQFKLFFATNHKPVIRGTDVGIWSRIHLIPFDVRFWDADKGESGPENLRMNKDLPQILRGEMPGILRWCVEGCLEWQRSGLKMPDEVRSATDEYRQEQDILAGFLADCCIMGGQYKATAKELFNAYQTWCEGQGEKPQTQTIFGRRLRERNLTNDRNNKGVFWIGIGLKSE